MRKIALITAAVMMSVGSVGTATATVAPVASTSSVSGVASNRLALGLAQSADDQTAESTGVSSTGIVIGIGAVIAIGLGVWAATTHTRTRPTSS